LDGLATLGFETKRFGVEPEMANEKWQNGSGTGQEPQAKMIQPFSG
jgi:hypothetical protein